ncbi:sigma 54-interacting transcriptional regulator [Aromatoleum toluclasticum]|uniref:sigma-54-dependent Fis family transcriptional regulator n=1 Tax=Aromatoleum toluclasticum TaxID=92003 RepID=UPI001D181518|nr:sigma 54-interacting transcriptional regulator [Aromatoleum toluclasticum]MCC4118474.1 sigma 54-interacting transcriptional regulator [Aromatoleum toluclasticum]
METGAFVERMGWAWKRFVENGEIDESIVRPEVARSWARCRQRGLDPYTPKTPITLTPQQVAELRDEYRGLIETARPFMAFLQTAVQGTGFLLALTERSGLVLELFGDEEIVASASEDNYAPGCCRGEEVGGTNSISVTLIEQAPIQLTGPEHWNARHHRWTCASAPVFSPEGTLLGSLTLTGETTSAHLHTLGMVISAAEAIQNTLREQEIALQKRGADAMLSSVLTSLAEAIVTIDASGTVTHINPAACKAFGVAPDETIDRSLAALFPDAPEVRAVLDRDVAGATFEVTTERLGARAHFVVAPLVMESEGAVQGAILTVRERRHYLNEVRGASGLNATFTFDDIVGRSPALLNPLDLARTAARQNVRVLILGETGTGKELFAQAIHNFSPRRHGPFVALNCAAIPRELMESEMFGYRSGAFTGSRKGGQVGKLELADGGTLFLDEINQMPLDLQAKLLRALQEGTITRLGDSKPIRVDVRVIAAANEDLYAKSCVGEFRQDLYFRLSVVELMLPPLRERPEDIALLAQSLLDKLARKLEKPGLTLSSGAIDCLRQYPWPGNVRELENVLEMATILCEGTRLEACHVTRRMRSLRTPEPAQLAQSSSPESSVREVELELIRRAVQEYHGNVAEAARKLGLSRSTVYRRMQQHGLTKEVTLR